MEIRFVAYDRLGARRGVVPNPLEAMVNKAYNDLTTLNLHYDRNSPNHAFLDNEPELAVETFKNNAWVETRGGRLRCLTVDFDHLEEVPTRRYDFIHVGEGLRGILVYGSYGLPTTDEGKVSFGNTNVGRVLDTVWANAVSRGWTGFSNSFNTTTDSAGNAWDKTFTISFAVGTSLLSIVNQFVAQGLMDIEWEGRTLHAYNKGTITPNLSTGANPLRLAGSGPGNVSTDAAPELIDQSSLATHVIVLGEGGLRWEFPTGAPVAEGRREIIQSYSGVDDIATAQLLADPIILKAQNHLKNTTRQFHLTPETTVLPIHDYDVGDWIDIQRGTAFENMQIIALNLQVNANGIQGYVTLGDRIDGLIETMYQRIQGLTGGIANEGGTPPTPSSRTPNPPAGLSVGTTALLDAVGKTYGQVTLSWLHDGMDTLGEVVDIKSYTAYYRPTGLLEWRPMFTTANKNGAFSPLETYDPYGAPYLYEFMVTATSSKDMVSEPSQSVYKEMLDDTTPPPKPTTPVSTVWLRSVSVAWNGKGLSDSAVVIDMPVDFRDVIVWEATASNMTGKVEVGRLSEANTLTLGSRPAGVTRWYALQAYDRSGNASAMSAASSITPTDLVSEATIDAALDAMSGDIGANVQATTDAREIAEQGVEDALIAKGIADQAQLDANQGITDAEAAQGTANTAASTAAAAQLAADKAKLAADAAALSATNVVAEPGFELGGDSWAPAAGWTFPDSATAHGGAKVAQFNATGALLGQMASDFKQPVLPGQLWVIDGWVRVVGTLPTAGDVRLALNTETTAGGQGYPTQLTLPAASLTNSWQRISGNYLVPEGIAYIRHRIRVDTATTAGTVVQFDDMGLTDITMVQKAIDDAATAQGKADTAFADAATAKGIADAAAAAALAAQQAADQAQLDATQAIADAEQAANDAEAARLLAVAAQSTTDGKVTVSPSVPTTGDLAGKKAFSMWTQVVANKVVGSWYKATDTATSWTAMPFDPVMIPQISIGTGTFGDLDGIRIAAASIKAASMFVGSYKNLIPNGNGEAGKPWGTTLLPVDTTVVPPSKSVTGSFKAVPTQRGSVDHSEMWVIDKTRTHKVTWSTIADVANSRYFLQLRYFDRNKAYVGFNEPAANVTMGTVWTDGSYTLLPASIPANAVYAQMRIYPNHTNGSAVANQWFAGLTMREMESGELIVDGAIKAIMVAANAIEADKIKAGAVIASKLEAVLSLVTRIVAGPEMGTHAEMDANGFHVFAADPIDGIPNEVARLGVAATNDLLTILKSNGEPAASISDDGKISGMEVHAKNALSYKGRELTDLLMDLPQGFAAYGDFYTGVNNITTEYGLFDIKIKAYPGRAYEVTMYGSTSSSVSGTGGAIHIVRIHHGGAAPSLASWELKRFEHSYSNGLPVPIAVTWLWYPQVAEPTDIRLLWSMNKYGTGVGTWHGGEMSIKDIGRERRTVGTPNTGGGTTAAPVEVRSATFQCTNSRNYLGSNAEYPHDPSHMYQGLSPAGYGNLKSIALFPDMTGTLANATINWIRVYFNFPHWYNNSGGLARIGVHGHSTLPTTFSSSGNITESGGWPKPGARWIDLPASTFASFKSGGLKGVSLEGNTASPSYTQYGFADRPTIEVNYTK